MKGLDIIDTLDMWNIYLSFILRRKPTIENLYKYLYNWYASAMNEKNSNHSHETEKNSFARR